MTREDAERRVDEAWKRALARRKLRSPLFPSPARDPTGGERAELATAILAAVAEERERCSGIVVKMRNQRQVYRDIIGNPKAQLPKHGHWADPFFEEAERMTREQEAVAERDRAWRAYMSKVRKAFPAALEDGRLALGWDDIDRHIPPPDRQPEEPAR